MTKRKTDRWLRGTLGVLLCLFLTAGLADAMPQSDEGPQRPRIRVRMVTPDSAEAGAGSVRVRSAAGPGHTFVIPLRPPRSTRRAADPGSPVTIELGGSGAGTAADDLGHAGRDTAAVPRPGAPNARDDGSLFQRLVGSGDSGVDVPATAGARTRDRQPAPAASRSGSTRTSPASGSSFRTTAPPARATVEVSSSTGASQPPRQVSGFRAESGRPVAVADGRTYRLGPGDTVDVFVWRDPDLSRQVPVRPDGLVSLPLIGELQAAGRTPAELERVITERLGEYVQMPQVTVTVTQIRSLVVYVVGNVANPGPLTLDREINVLQAIAMAGGLTEFADDDEIVILRTLADGTEQRLPFDYSDVVDGSRPAQNLRLRSGDIIYVP